MPFAIKKGRAVRLLYTIVVIASVSLVMRHDTLKVTDENFIMVIGHALSRVVGFSSVNIKTSEYAEPWIVLGK